MPCGCYRVCYGSYRLRPRVVDSRLVARGFNVTPVTFYGYAFYRLHTRLRLLLPVVPHTFPRLQLRLLHYIALLLPRFGCSHTAFAGLPPHTPLLRLRLPVADFGCSRLRCCCVTLFPATTTFTAFTVLHAHIQFVTGCGCTFTHWTLRLSCYVAHCRLPGYILLLRLLLFIPRYITHWFCPHGPHITPDGLRYPLPHICLHFVGLLRLRLHTTRYRTTAFTLRLPV